MHSHFILSLHICVQIHECVEIVLVIHRHAMTSTGGIPTDSGHTKIDGKKCQFQEDFKASFPIYFTKMGYLNFDTVICMKCMHSMENICLYKYIICNVVIMVYVLDDFAVDLLLLCYQIVVVVYCTTFNMDALCIGIHMHNTYGCSNVLRYG